MFKPRLNIIAVLCFLVAAFNLGYQIADRHTERALKAHAEAISIANKAIAEQRKANDSLERCVDYLKFVSAK